MEQQHRQWIINLYQHHRHLTLLSNFQLRINNLLKIICILNQVIQHQYTYLNVLIIKIMPRDIEEKKLKEERLENKINDVVCD